MWSTTEDQDIPMRQTEARTMVNAAAIRIRTTQKTISIALEDFAYTLPSSAKIFRTIYVLTKSRNPTKNPTRTMSVMFAVLTLSTLEL